MARERVPVRDRPRERVTFHPQHTTEQLPIEATHEQVTVRKEAARRVSRRDRVEPGATVADAVSGLSEGLGALVRGHLALARVEMTQDFKALARDLGVALGGTPIILVGYLLFWIAVGNLLSRAMANWVAFLICAVANFVIGGAMMVWGRKKSKTDKIAMSESKAELRKAREWLPTLREPPETLRGHLH